MNMIFDEKSHSYFVDGQRVLSVTQYLKLAGLIDSDWYTEESRQRGSAVHAAIFYRNQNDLDESSLHPIVAPFVAAYDKFVADTGFVPELVEHRVYDPIWIVAGTLDAAGTWKLGPDKIVIDFKTGNIEPWARLQLAQYEACLNERHRRFGLQLKPDGTYRLSEEYRDREDIRTFRAIVSIVNWRIQNGLLTPERELAA